MAHYILDSVSGASPPPVSVRDGALADLSEAMAPHVLGSAFVAFPSSVSGREGTPEELSETRHG